MNNEFTTRIRAKSCNTTTPLAASPQKIWVLRNAHLHTATDQRQNASNHQMATTAGGNNGSAMPNKLTGTKRINPSTQNAFQRGAFPDKQSLKKLLLLESSTGDGGFAGRSSTGWPLPFSTSSATLCATSVIPPARTRLTISEVSYCSISARTVDS